MNVGLIVGCARSGTSILGELIAAHPDVSYIHEAHGLWESAGPGVDDGHRFTERHATAEVTANVRRWFEERGRRKPLVVEKTPRNVLRIPFLRAALPEARIIHIVRDGRDVACSMVPGCGGDEWEHLQPPSWRILFETTRGAVRCAWAWKEVMEIAVADFAGVPHLELRYEDLLREPAENARRVLEYLGLSPSAAVTQFCSKIQDQTRGSYQAQKSDKWYRDDHSRRMGRWRENLTAEEQATITPLLLPLLRRWGYA